MSSRAGRTEPSTPAWRTNAVGSGDRVIDLNEIRRAAEVDFKAAILARRQACAMLRGAWTILAATAQTKQDAHRLRAEAFRLRAEAIRARDDATTDELTGALRRNAGFAALEREVSRARRDHKDLVIGFLDVDGLKQVNDSEGHQTGDDVLRVAVETLRASLRSYDVVVRYGGDEFVFSIGDANLRAAERRIETMRTLLAERLPGRTVSAGFADVRPGDDLDAVIRRADVDLYMRRSRIRREFIGPLGPTPPP